MLFRSSFGRRVRRKVEWLAAKAQRALTAKSLGEAAPSSQDVALANARPARDVAGAFLETEAFMQARFAEQPGRFLHRGASLGPRELAEGGPG